MEHKSVSKSEQMESPVECEGLLDEGHRCGACQKVSDAKVRIIIKYSKKVKCSSRVFFAYILFCWFYESFIPEAFGASRWGCKCPLK